MSSAPTRIGSAPSSPALSSLPSLPPSPVPLELAVASAAVSPSATPLQGRVSPAPSPKAAPAAAATALASCPPPSSASALPPKAASAAASVPAEEEKSDSPIHDFIEILCKALLQEGKERLMKKMLCFGYSGKEILIKTAFLQEIVSLAVLESQVTDVLKLLTPEELAALQTFCASSEGKTFLNEVGLSSPPHQIKPFVEKLQNLDALTVIWDFIEGVRPQPLDISKLMQASTSHSSSGYGVSYGASSGPQSYPGAAAPKPAHAAAASAPTRTGAQTLAEKKALAAQIVAKAESGIAALLNLCGRLKYFEFRSGGFSDADALHRVERLKAHVQPQLPEILRAQLVEAFSHENLTHLTRFFESPAGDTAIKKLCEAGNSTKVHELSTPEEVQQVLSAIFAQHFSHLLNSCGAYMYSSFNDFKQWVEFAANSALESCDPFSDGSSSSKG